MTLPIHPVAEIFPLMSDAELRELGADIKAHGQLEPIWTFQGAIVDGRNRYDACCIQEVEPRIRELPADTDLLAFVLGKNLHRRQLNESQRAIVAANIANLRSGQKKKTPANIGENTKGPPIGGPGISQSDAAKTMNVSERTVQRASKVVKNAPREVVEQVQAGSATVADAEAVAEEPKEVQKAAAEKVKKKAAKTLKEGVAQVKAEEVHPVEEPTTDWPVDALGIPIQDHAIEAFESIPKFDELAKLLRQVGKLYSELAELPGGEFLRRHGVSINSPNGWKSKGIQDALAAVQDCKPAYTVCPWTVNHLVHPEAQFTHDAECSLCKGKNWSRVLRKHEPAYSLLEKLKEVHGV